jgi:hypothetical protein
MVYGPPSGSDVNGDFGSADLVLVFGATERSVYGTDIETRENPEKDKPACANQRKLISVRLPADVIARQSAMAGSLPRRST